MCEREEIVDGYRTHWKVDELKNGQQICHKFRSGNHLICLIIFPVFERAELDSQDWPVLLGSLELETKQLTQSHDVINFFELTGGINILP